MDSTTKLRWSMLMALLAATVAAIFYPVEQDSVDAPAQAPVPGKANIPVAGASTGPGRASVWEPLLVDPFSPRQWEPPAPAPAAIVATVETAPVVAPPAVVAPPLPFQFVGQMSDNAEKVVYLARGDVAVLARNGEILDGTYKVLAVSDLQIEFEHLPTAQKQVLVFPVRNN